MTNIEAPNYWRGRLDRAISEWDPHTLAEIILWLEMLVKPSYLFDGPDPLPNGRPPHDVVVAAGRMLLERLGELAQADRWAWEALALPAASRYGRRDPGEVDAKLARYREALERASVLAEGKDQVLELLILARLARCYRDEFALDNSVSAAMRMLTILDRDEGDRPSIIDRLVATPDFLPPRPEVLARFRVDAHIRASLAARFHRDYTTAIEHRDDAIRAAERLIEDQPNLLVESLGVRAALARATGDLPKNDECLLRQRELVRELNWWMTNSLELNSRGSEALAFADFETALACQVQRLVVRLRGEGFEIQEPITPELTLSVVAEITQAGRLPLLTAVGNISYEIARYVISSGRCLFDPGARVEARGWLGVADAAWADIGMNGVVAVRFRQLELDVLDGVAPPPLEVGRRMADLSREWRRPVGQRRAAIQATHDGEAGDPVVLQRLLELRQDAPPIDRAHLDVGVARWHLRAGDQAHSTKDSSTAADHWAIAVSTAASAAEGLLVRQYLDQLPTETPIAEVYLSLEQYIEAMSVQADALRRLRQIPPPAADQRRAVPTTSEELNVRLRVLPAMARRLAATGTTLQRRTTARQLAPLLSAALELALELDDADAVDAISEVARRDATGSILASMAREPGMSDDIARLARELTAAFRANLSDDSEPEGPRAGGEGQDSTGTAAHPDQGHRALVIEDRLMDTLDVFGTLVGPVARALIDPTDVTSATAEKLLGIPGAPHAILSLWLHDNHVVRHLAWRTEGGVEHRLDQSPAPPWLAGFDVSEEPNLLMAAVDTLTTVLFPPDLLARLAEIDPEHPLHLTIVPTGLMVIPFAAVPVSRQYLLVDLAVITIVQSLTAAIALSRADDGSKPEGQPIATYDTRRLKHAQSEYDLLWSHRGPIHRVSSLEELRAAMAGAHAEKQHGMFVLALHGLRGSDGWSQAKVMPNGDLLRTAHVLEWNIPSLVVGASCDTDIRADDGGELGGFPLAFQMKGAQLVVGTLTRVNDEATADIMGLFYAAIASEIAPAAALREAQRTWLKGGTQRGQNRRADRHLWAFHVAYGHSPSGSRPEERNRL